MPLFYHLRQIIEAVGLYEPAALGYLRWLAWRKNIRLKTGEGISGPILSFHDPSQRRLIIARRHIMYGRDMIESFDYYFDAVVPASVDGESVVDYSQPAWHTLVPSGIRLHFSSLPESDVTTALYLEKAALGPGQVVIDLGGYCGASSYFFARAGGPTSRVLCLEPDPLNYESLQKNIEFHQLKDVRPLPLAAWSHTGKLRFETEGNLGSGVNEIHTRNTRSIEIESITLDELAVRESLDRIDFIKMDIEGAEVPVLKSASVLLKKYRPRLMIEPHMVAGKLNAPEIVRILEEIGYRTEFITQGELSVPLIFATFN